MTRVRRSAAIVAAAAALSMTAASAAPKGWTVLAPSGAQFTVDLPPGCTAALAEDAKALYDSRLWNCSQNGTWRYSVGYTEYRHVESAGGEIATDRDNFNTVVHAKMDSQRIITTDGVRGIEFFSHSDRMRFHVRMWVRGNRAYEIGAAAPGAPAPDEAHFVESFHFLR